MNKKVRSISMRSGFDMIKEESSRSSVIVSSDSLTTNSLGDKEFFDQPKRNYHSKNVSEVDEKALTDKKEAEIAAINLDFNMQIVDLKNKHQTDLHATKAQYDSDLKDIKSKNEVELAK